MRKAKLIAASMLVPSTGRLAYAGEEVTEDEMSGQFGIRIDDGHLVEIKDQDKAEGKPKK